MCSPFIGKTVTVSGQLAASTSTPHTLFVQYSTTVDDSNSGSWTSITAATTSGSLTPTSTTFVSFANTYAIPSTAKTVRVALQPTGTVANAVALYYGNIQLEVGSSASTFSRAGATIQGELAACQRYYFRNTQTANNQHLTPFGTAVSSTAAAIDVFFPVSMRTNPTAIESANLAVTDGANARTNVTSVTFNASSNLVANCEYNVASGLTQYRPYSLFNQTSTTAYVGFSAEL
jgi:hypothetical protein